MRPSRLTTVPCFRRILLVAAACSGAVACGGTLGPLVTDVEYGNKGELIVTRCMLEISGGGNMTTYELNTCKRTVTSAPSPGSAGRQPESDVPPPEASGATVAH